MALLRLSLGAALLSATAVLASPPPPRITTAPDLARRQADVKVAAVVPTSEGQIGINPVSIELGDPDVYVFTDFGPNNPVVTWDGKTYQYIEGHTKYLTLETITTTQDNQPVTTTTEVKATAVTATAQGPDQAVGDIAVTFSQEIADALRVTTDKAVASCNLKKRSLGRRQDQVNSFACLVDASVQASGKDGPLEAISDYVETIAVELAENAPVYLANAIAVLQSQAQKKKALLILAAMWAGIKVSGGIAAVNIPAKGVGSNTKQDDDSKKCDPSKPADKESPICSDDTCKGDDDKKLCTVDPVKDCACLRLAKDQHPQEFNKDWWDEQQKVIQSVADNHRLLAPEPTQDVPSPSCSATSGDDNNLANMESKVWSKLIDSFCAGLKDDPLSGPLSVTKKTSDDDVKIDTYQDWTFDFKLETTRQSGCTAYQCKDVFGKFKSCSYDSHTGFRTGSLQLDCGTASYAMNPPQEADAPPEQDPPAAPKTELVLADERCYGRDEFGGHGDVHEGAVASNSGWACAGTARKEQTVKAGDRDSFISFQAWDGGVPLQYNVYWKDGCELANGWTEVYAANPLNKEKPSYTECQDMLVDRWRRCDNGGVGGSIQAGCLVYEFKVQKKE